jgi:hypothetical protein
MSASWPNAANRSVSQRFLRVSAAATLISEAQAGNVLSDVTPTSADRKRADRLCSAAARH